MIQLVICGVVLFPIYGYEGSSYVGCFKLHTEYECKYQSKYYLPIYICIY